MAHSYVLVPWLALRGGPGEELPGACGRGSTAAWWPPHRAAGGAVFRELILELRLLGRLWRGHCQNAGVVPAKPTDIFDCVRLAAKLVAGDMGRLSILINSIELLYRKFSFPFLIIDYCFLTED